MAERRSTGKSSGGSKRSSSASKRSSSSRSSSASSTKRKAAAKKGGQARGLEVAEPPRRLPGEERELAQPDGRRLRPSDHAPVVARFDVRSPPVVT